MCMYVRAGNVLLIIDICMTEIVRGRGRSAKAEVNLSHVATRR